MKRFASLAGHWSLLWVGVCTYSLTGCASPLAQRFQQHIDYLASDALEGRGVGTKGISLAADYIAGQFADIGLEPAGDEGTYFQTFAMTLHRTLTDQTRLAWEDDKGTLQLRRDFIPFHFSSEEAFSGDVVFCGYGIVAPKRKHDDFARVDLTGKVALILRGEPPSWSDENGRTTPHAMFRNKVYNAKDRGAVAVLIVNQKPAEGERDELMDFLSEGADAYGMAAFHLSRSVVDASLTAAGFGSLAELEKKLNAGRYLSGPLKGVRASGQAVFKTARAATRNVVGVLRGEGPLADEAVVVGAHYDHLGIRRPMTRTFRKGRLVRRRAEPQIHNGADDNASGVSGLIEAARMLVAGPKPKRTIVFIAFTAEESGLHGSKHYVDHPPIPIERTVAMVNMDMIGRMPRGTHRVEVFGARTGAGFMDILEKEGRTTGLDISPTPAAGGRSDHATFVRKKIPSLHFFTGQHADYHKPTDDADKINARGGARVASLVYRTTYDLATLAHRPQFVEVKAPKPETTEGGTPTYRVVMGLAPGYGDDGKAGMAVEAVTPQGPADLAGMKAGDRIIRIGDKPVVNVYDYMAATRQNNAGDTVEVTVLRKKKKLTLRVTLAAAG